MPKRRRRRKAAGGVGRDRQSKGDFNLINDATPLRVCFNHQDTLQQVDRMFTVNFRMSSEWAVSINNMESLGSCAAAGLEPAGRTPAPGGCFSLLVSGGSRPRRTGVGALWPGSFLSGKFPGLPTKIRAPGSLPRKTTGSVIRGWGLGIGWLLSFHLFPRNVKLPPWDSDQGTPLALWSSLVAPYPKAPGNPGRPS